MTASFTDGGGLLLRLGQAFFSFASLLFMSVGVDFYSYTSFCFLVTIMGLLIPWSFILAMIDGYSIYMGCPIRQPGIILVILMGDWALSMLSLAAASSTASCIQVLIQIDDTYCPPKFCSRYQMSAAMAFLSWILTGFSSLYNMNLLASM